MQTVEITTERQNSGCPAITVNYTIGGDLDELRDQFDDATVYTHARRSLINSVQSFKRTLIDKGVDEGKTYEQIVRMVEEGLRTWKPSRRKVAKTAKEKAEQIFAKLSPSERLAVLKEYEAKVLAAEQEAAE